MGSPKELVILLDQSGFCSQITTSQQALYRPQIQTPALECVVSILVFVYFYSICTRCSVVLGHLLFLLWVSLWGQIETFWNASLNIPPHPVQEGHASQIIALLLPSNDLSHSIQKSPTTNRISFKWNMWNPLYRLVRNTAASSRHIYTPLEGISREFISKTSKWKWSDAHPGRMSFHCQQRTQNGARRFIWTYKECLWCYASLLRNQNNLNNPHNFIHNCVWGATVHTCQRRLVTVLYKALLL